VRIRAKAGLADVRLHDLRHSFASIAVGAGMSLPLLGKLLGHTQASTTMRYAHLQDNPMRQAAALGRVLINAVAGGMSALGAKRKELTGKPPVELSRK
jgi:integrase